MITLSLEPEGKDRSGTPYWAFRAARSGELIGIRYYSYWDALRDLSELLIGVQLCDARVF